MGFKEDLNSFGSARTPCFFIINFEQDEYEVLPLSSLPSGIRYEIESKKSHTIHAPKLSINPIDFECYKKIFDFVIEEIGAGNCYMLNLCFETPLDCDSSLLEIYENAHALFKLYYRDKFVSFSPERFVRIKDDKIHTYPMKGTINASIDGAKELLLESTKEHAEHVMVVDLLRNDLSIVAKNVRVARFRYIDEIKIQDGAILQASSEIIGELGSKWQDRVGDIISNLLPAGSISGTPKAKSVQIINRLELQKRGFFSGIWGIFDGEMVDSGVLIRFIEKRDGGLVYKSGCGITIESDVRAEYEEMKEKIYVPIF